MQSPQERIRSVENLSPAPQQSPGSLGSLQRESKNGTDYRKRVPALSPSPEKSPLTSESPPRVSAREKRRLSSPYGSPVKQPREQIARYGSASPLRKPREPKLRRDSPKESEEEEDGDHRPRSLERRSKDTSRINKQITSPAKIRNKEEYSPERVASGQQFTESRSHLDSNRSRNKEQEMKSGKPSGMGHPEIPDIQNEPTIYKVSLPGETQQASNPGEVKKADDKNRSHSKNTKDDSEQHRKPGSLHSAVEIIDHSNQSGALDSGSEDSDKRRSGGKEKRKNKRPERQEVTSDDDYSYDSEIERKEAKRRRKEEKRSRKEKKRRRREERRHRREERRAEKQKVKNSGDASASDGEHVAGREFHSSDNEETEAVQKKLEIELRKKALETLKAKKGISQ